MVPITMRDVAAKAGVTPIVVSRVLHNKASTVRVSEATAERVRQAAQDLGYRVNVWARNFRARQTMTIGVLHGVGAQRPKFDQGSRYFAGLMDGLIEGAFKNGYSVTLCPKLLGQSSEDAMSDGRFDGLVWYSSVASDEHLDALTRCSVPLVLIHARAAEFGNRHPAVICDNQQGIALAIDHLLKFGHTRIAFAMDANPPNVESIARLAAFEHHMECRGLVVKPGDILEIGWDKADIDTYFLDGPRHTAVVAHNDDLAAEFMRRAALAGIKVPRDFSVIGFDSTSYCEEVTPKLTSIHQPLQAMAECAIDLLVKAIHGEINDPLDAVFPCRLDVRASTKPR